MFKILNIFFLFISCSTLMAKSSPFILKKKRIYEDESFRVDDVLTKYNQSLRFFGPNNVIKDGINHGKVDLNNVDNVISPYIKLMMGGLYLQKATLKIKHILFIGLGIGVLPRAFNQIILKDSHIDVVEIDERIYYIAQKYFFLKKSPRLNVFIGDGFDYVMNLTNEKYDMIVLDAFMDLSQEICAPDTFVTERFVLKVKKHLNKNGVFAVNTLPHFCSKYSYERNLYHSIFGRIYMGSFWSNNILIALNGKAPTKRQIESRIRYYEKLFIRVGTDARWIAQMFNNFKRYKRNSFYGLQCDLYSYTFGVNYCLI